LLERRVTDPSKAVIVDAKVAAISTYTNLHCDGNTNGGNVLDGSAL
jgi:hypothetical protein